MKESDIKKTLLEIHRVLSPNGTVYIETPNPSSLIAKTMGKNWWMFLEEHATLIPPKILVEMLFNADFNKSKGYTKSETNWQVNEVNKILRRVRAPGLRYMPFTIKYFIVKSIIQIFDEGGVTIATAHKKSNI